MRMKSSLIALVFVITCFGVASVAHAQVVGQPYRLSDKEVERILHRVENQANNFRRSLDAALDRSRLDGTNREDDINAFIKNFDEQTKRLRDRFDDNKSVAADVEAVLNGAASIDQFMEGWTWTFEPKGRAAKVRYNAVRYEYAVIQPITEVATGELILNFYPQKRGTPVVKLHESDRRMFALV